MSDINGKGYGSSHDWRDIGGKEGISYYECKDCKERFTHYYHKTHNIFKALEEEKATNICSKLTMSEFKEFQKISRISRPCVITEKIDGTNGQIYITEDLQIYAASRNRYLTEEDDNHGFYKWVMENKEELLQLGPGRHFGEWWGIGINKKRYSIQEKRFSLFNVNRFKENRPACCHVVPVLAEIDILDTEEIERVMNNLAVTGSIASGISTDKAEGIVIYHSHSGYLFKKTFDNDGVPKSLIKDKK